MINIKRQTVQYCLETHPEWSAYQVAKQTKSSLEMVQTVRYKLSAGTPLEYTYNNLKSEKDLSQLRMTVQTAGEDFRSVADIKSMHPTFSRTFILKELHEVGMKWKELPKVKKPSKHPPPNSTKVRAFISHVTQGHNDPDTEVLFCDEFKLPLQQTPTSAWTKPEGLEEGIVYNHRPDAVATMLTACAICSKEGFLAVQVFKDEVNGAGFSYFIDQVLSQLFTDKKYLLVADNASWHKSALVQKTPGYRFLFFNEPRFFMLNLIENAFSFIRFMFRSRPRHLLGNIEDEARHAVGLFFHPQNSKRFKGIYRNHLRQLIKYGLRHREALLN